MREISASVGARGVNRKPDVTIVQQLLVAAGMNPGAVDGYCGPKTKAAILGFQHTFLKHPDGVVDPGGRTLARLNEAAEKRKMPRPSAPQTPPAPSKAILTDWSGDSVNWSQEKKLASLNSGFRQKAARVVERLKQAGFQPHIVYGWRSVARQKELVKAGNSKVLFSFHNAQTPQGVPNAWAADVIDKRWAWKEPDCHKFFKALGAEAKKEGLVWGGDWVSFRDWAHIQGRGNGELEQVKRESGL